MPLASVTGGASDELTFVGNISQYDEPKREFPINYGDSWSSTSNTNYEFLLTVAAFGLNNVSGAAHEEEAINYSVSGWGTLRLPDVNGGPAIEHEALLLKSETTVTLTYFLGGAPAPAPLLAAFGLTQGATSTFKNYIFLVKGLEDRAFEISDRPLPFTCKTKHLSAYSQSRP